MHTSPSLKQRTVEQIGIGSESAAIRAGDPNNYDEVIRLQELLNSEGYLRYFSPPNDLSTGAQMNFSYIDAMSMLNQDPNTRLKKLLEKSSRSSARFIISRSALHYDNSHGELQGLVCVGLDNNYKSLHDELEVIRVEKGLPLLQFSPYPRLEIACMKHPDAMGKQIGSGVRQVLYQVYQAASHVIEVQKLNDGTYRVDRFAHLEDKSPSSSDTRQELEKGLREGITVGTPVVVIAYIEPDNIGSVRVALSAGFVLINSQRSHHVYQLDWNLWQEKLRTGRFELR
ncbi:hypothetical protein H6764_00535 [Candidatus Nomurabacteria bacterium]|nr:hypothetical protein [Candidatus Nomurabacteria bacterium]